MEKHLSVEEVAAALDMNPESVRRCLRKGNLQGRKEGRDWQIPESEVAKKFEILQHYRVFCKASSGATWESSFLAPKWPDWTQAGSGARSAPEPGGSPPLLPALPPADPAGIRAGETAADAATPDAAVAVALAVSAAKQARSAVVAAIKSGGLTEREYDIQIYPQLVFLRELTGQMEEAWQEKTALEETVKDRVRV